MRPLVRNLLTAGIAAGAARAELAHLRARPPGGEARWDRLNHRGETLTLLEGPAMAASASIAIGLARGVPGRLRAAGLLATLASAAFGANDDLRESGRSKGLRGHLGELAHGRLTTGGLKVLGIGASGVAAAALAGPRRSGPPAMGGGAVGGPVAGGGSGRLVSAADAVLGGALVAGAANLVNLLDLRPGRALKVVLLAAPAIGSASAGPLLAAAGGAAAALLPDDLAERSMLGDTGANAAGALLGTAALAGLGRRGRVAAVAVLVGLTLASERVSFTRVIESTPGLREFDALGRRPPPSR